MLPSSVRIKQVALAMPGQGNLQNQAKILMQYGLPNWQDHSAHELRYDSSIQACRCHLVLLYQQIVRGQL